MIYEEDILKDVLISLDIKRVLDDDNYRASLLQSMLSHIGSVDPVLRDHLIYSNFAKLIGGSLIPQSEMASMLDRCLDQDHLFYKIGEKNTDSVFTRSFSSLVVALILTEDNKTTFLTSMKLQEVSELILTYLHEEKDIRGYVEGKEWAHSIAHGADMLSALIKHHHFHVGNLPKVLNAIQACLLKGIVYTDEEEERLIFVIEALLEKGIKQDVLVSWLNNLSLTLERSMVEEGNSLTDYRSKIMVSNFMKALFFRLKHSYPNKELLQCLENNIHYWFRKSYGQ